MAIILMLMLFGLFLGIEYARRPIQVLSDRAVDYAWEDYKWAGAYAQDGGETIEPNFLGEGI